MSGDIMSHSAARALAYTALNRDYVRICGKTIVQMNIPDDLLESFIYWWLSDLYDSSWNWDELDFDFRRRGGAQVQPAVYADYV